MAFAGMNHFAILVAAMAAWLFGAIYYTTLSKPWLAAAGITREAMQQRQVPRRCKAAAVSVPELGAQHDGS